MGEDEQHEPWRASETALLMALLAIVIMGIGVLVNGWIAIAGMLLFFISGFAALILTDNGR